jgi:hypothetical protein
MGPSSSEDASHVVRDDSEEYSSLSSCATPDIGVERRAPPSHRARALYLVSTACRGRAVTRGLAPEERRRRSEAAVRPAVRHPHARGVGAPPLRLHQIRLLARTAGAATARTASAASSPRRRAADDSQVQEINCSTVQIEKVVEPTRI